MSTQELAPTFALSPFAWVGRAVLDAVGYLGRLAVLLAAVIGAIVRPKTSGRSLIGLASEQLGWMFACGFPLVAIVHFGLGSFLAMQSYFGGTFVEGTGAVVGVGLLRNVAPLFAGLTLAGLVAARITPELLARTRLDDDRDVAARVLAAIVAGPVLAAWGAAVGTAVGWQVAQTMMGVSSHNFFTMFWEMLWARDVIGVVAKGLLYGFFAGLFACQEGRGPLRGTDAGLDARAAATCRAACLAMTAILILNSGWFLLVYHAAAAFGPTLMAPPTT